MEQLPTAPMRHKHNFAYLAWKITKKTLKYSFYFVLFYFAWEGFMAWK